MRTTYVVLILMVLRMVPTAAVAETLRVGDDRNPPLLAYAAGPRGDPFPGLLATSAPAQGLLPEASPVGWSQGLPAPQDGALALLSVVTDANQPARSFAGPEPTVLSGWGQTVRITLMLLGAVLTVSLVLLWSVRRWFKRSSQDLKHKELQLREQLAERKSFEEELQERRQQYHVLFEENQSAMLLVDPEAALIVDGNAAACRFYGYQRQELIGKQVSAINTLPEDQIRSALARAQQGQGCCFQFRHRLAGGELRDVEVFSSQLVVGGRSLLCSIVHDIGERLQAEQELAAKRDFLQAVIDGVVEPLMVIAPDFSVMLMNKAAQRQTTATATDRAFLCHQVSHGTDEPCTGADHPCPVVRVQKTGLPVTMVHNHMTPEGRKIVELYASPLWNPDGSLHAVISASRDITAHLQIEAQLRDNEERLKHLAHHDPLTDLPNRLLFDDRLERALAVARRHDQQVALLFLDLDRFKNINDTLGHECGDQLLKKVAERLLLCVRETDTVARLGGDEFLIILEQVKDFQMVAAMSQRIRQSLARYLPVENYQLFVTASIGISLFPGDATSSRELLKCADIAMYHAKQEGKDNYQFYKPQLNARAHEMLELERDLRQAVSGEQLELYYQPQFDLRQGRLIGMEALLRWSHPEHGMIAPADFIPIAEETGLIVGIGEWVLREACLQVCAWQEQALAPPRVAVNLSGRQLRQHDFIAMVDQVLADTELHPEWLELEITESILMKDVQSNFLALNELKGRGVQLSVDDFGTGYSSLSYLSRFPVGKLKIDRSFVATMTENYEQAAIIDSILALGHGLNLTVIAEGIETAEQRALLEAKGCLQGQGYLFGRPVPAREFRDSFLVAPPELSA
ncbi:MAG TPA: EAL domain-containing protein [Geopsychrobacteraceae bacterium]